MRLFILSLLFTLITGCGHNPTIPEERIVYHTVLVTPPDELLKDCELQSPPDIQKYLMADWSDKEALLVEAYDAALRKAILCNTTKSSLREWKKEQQKIYSTDKSPGQ
jgi:hypothetical protein